MKNTNRKKNENKIPDNPGLVRKTDFDKKSTGTENKIPVTTGLLTKTNFNAKVTEIENKIRDVSEFYEH